MVKEKHLKRKGWEKHEVDHAKKVHAHAKRIQKKEHRMLDELSYWMVLLFAVGSTIALGLWIVPLFVLANTITLYLFLGIISLSFGVLFNHTLKDLDHLDKHHHLIYIFILPLASVVSFLAVTGQTNRFGGNIHDGAVAGAVFGILLMLPYFLRVMNK